MIESEKLSHLTTICNLYPFVAAVMLLGVFMSDIAPAKEKNHHLYPFVGISIVIRRIPHHGEMTIPLFSPCSLTMVQMAATGRYLQGLMAMPMEMSSLGPTVGKLVGFLGPVKIEEPGKNQGFYEQIHRTCLLMGKSIEHLQCHRIYLFNTYGGMAQDS